MRLKYILAVLLLWLPVHHGFLSPVIRWQVEQPPSSSWAASCPNHRRCRLSLPLKSTYNMFGAFGDFLNQKNFDDANRTQSNTQNNMNDDEDRAAGTFRIVELPVHQIKPGGLRLFLMFYLMGMQNTPEQNSWKAHQPSTEEFAVDFWFHDHSAVLCVELSEQSVTIDRVGSTPSTQFLMQEAVIVQGILDELEQIANDERIELKDRLLILQDQDAIEKARQTLAFG